MGEEEEPCGSRPAQAPKVHSDGRVGDLDPVHGGEDGIINGIFIGTELLREPAISTLKKVTLGQEQGQRP